MREDERRFARQDQASNPEISDRSSQCLKALAFISEVERQHRVSVLASPGSVGRSLDRMHLELKLTERLDLQWSFWSSWMARRILNPRHESCAPSPKTSNGEGGGLPLTDFVDCCQHGGKTMFNGAAVSGK